MPNPRYPGEGPPPSNLPPDPMGDGPGDRPAEPEVRAEPIEEQHASGSIGLDELRESIDRLTQAMEASRDSAEPEDDGSAQDDTTGRDPEALERLAETVEQLPQQIAEAVAAALPEQDDAPAPDQPTPALPDAPSPEPEPDASGADGTGQAEAMEGATAQLAEAASQLSDAAARIEGGDSQGERGGDAEQIAQAVRDGIESAMGQGGSEDGTDRIVGAIETLGDRIEGFTEQIDAMKSKLAEVAATVRNQSNGGSMR